MAQDILSQTIASRSLGGGNVIIPEDIPIAAIVGLGNGQTVTFDEAIANSGLSDSLTKDNVQQIDRIALSPTGPADYIRNSDYRLVNDTVDWSIAPQLPAPNISSVDVSSSSIGSSWGAGTWYYAVTAVDSDGRESMPGAGVSITDPADKLVTVAWAAVPRAAKYKVYRKKTDPFTTPGQAYLIATVDSSTLTFDDNNSATSADLVTPPTVSASHLGSVALSSAANYPSTPAANPFKVGRYTYAVTSVDGSGNETVPFLTQYVDIDSTMVNSAIRLTFVASSNRSQYINVYRRFSTGPWSKIAALSSQSIPSASPYDDTNGTVGVTSAVPPTATVSILGGAVESALVNTTAFNSNFTAGQILYEVTALDRESSPNEAPSNGTFSHNVLATDVSKEIILTWPEVPGCGGYRIYRTVSGVRVRIFTTRATDITTYVDSNVAGSAAEESATDPK